MSREAKCPACNGRYPEACLVCCGAGTLPILDDSVLSAATARDADEIRALREEVERLGAENSALNAIAEKARAVVDAADACDREAERHPSARSSAPLVRYINAMKNLKESIRALRGPGGQP